MEPVRYGELQSEKKAAENTVARQIVNEINKFGITDRQRWLIMYFLGLELENIDDMRKVTSFIVENKQADIFVSTTDDSER